MAHYPRRGCVHSFRVGGANTQSIRKDLIITSKRWKLPKLRPADFFNKLQFHQIQGINNMWFCGTDTSLTGHEGAIVSGLVLAEYFGARYPFHQDDFAKMQFNIVKDVMGIRHWQERLSSKASDFVFNLLKKFNLHKTQSHKFIRDMLM